MRTFAYGSNLSVPRMSERCPSATIAGVGRLPGHRLTFNRYSDGWKGGVADVVPDPASEVWGVVWDLSPSDMSALDDYEGYPAAYTRIETTIELRSGQRVDAWVYTVVEKSSFVAPRPEYLKIILDSAEAFAFPEEYRSHLAATPVDPRD